MWQVLSNTVAYSTMTVLWKTLRISIWSRKCNLKIVVIHSWMYEYFITFIGDHTCMSLIWNSKRKSWMKIQLRWNGTKFYHHKIAVETNQNSSERRLWFENCNRNESKFFVWASPQFMPPTSLYSYATQNHECIELLCPCSKHTANDSWQTNQKEPLSLPAAIYQISISLFNYIHSIQPIKTLRWPQKI